MKNIDLYGFCISNAPLTETAREIADRIGAGKRTAVFTPNPEMLERAICDRRFASVLRAGDILTPDGVGVCLASRLLCGERIPRVCGVDLGRALVSIAEERGWKVFFLGGAPGVADEAAAHLVREHPHLHVAGTLHGYFDAADAILAAVDRASPDLLFVCLGSPKQEKWIAENLPRLSHPCAALGLGGSLDVYASRVCRAPRLFCFFGLEWLWRIGCDPRRIGRSRALFKFGARVIRDAVKMRLSTVQRAQSERARTAPSGKKSQMC